MLIYWAPHFQLEQTVPSVPTCLCVDAEHLSDVAMAVNGDILKCPFLGGNLKRSKRFLLCFYLAVGKKVSIWRIFEYLKWKYLCFIEYLIKCCIPFLKCH